MSAITLTDFTTKYPIVIDLVDGIDIHAGMRIDGGTGVLVSAADGQADYLVEESPEQVQRSVRAARTNRAFDS